MAVTSVDVDVEMLAEAKRAYGVKTNREAINLALRDVVSRRRQIEAIRAIARIPLDLDPAKIPFDD